LSSQLRSIDDHGDHVHGSLRIAIAILELAEQNQDQNDNKHETKPAAAIVAGPVEGAATEPAKTTE